MSNSEMQFQPMIEFWHRSKCPKCKSVNWTSHSHSQRSEPIRNPEICKCWNCRIRYWLMDKETVKDIYPIKMYKDSLEDGETLMDVCGALEDEGRKIPL